ncbi:MAG: hypothetical protein K2X09_02330 [Rickettsiales bacterium]|nr:hypothetical protein [Rickettsiales bacterium]
MTELTAQRLSSKLGIDAEIAAAALKMQGTQLSPEARARGLSIALEKEKSGTWACHSTSLHKNAHDAVDVFLKSAKSPLGEIYVPNYSEKDVKAIMQAADQALKRKPCPLGL